jgi:hypothetical protein
VSARRRGKDLERRAASVLGVRRCLRGGTSSPDLDPVVLPSGRRLIVEAKSRSALPAIVTEALAQARRYARDEHDVPVGVIARRGGVAVAVLDLRDLAALLGIEVVHG